MLTNAMLRNIFHALVLMVAFVGLGTGAAHADYTYTDLYTLGMPAGFSSIATDVSRPAADGQVVGYGTTTGNNTHALLWNGSGWQCASIFNACGRRRSRIQRPTPSAATPSTWPCSTGRQRQRVRAIAWTVPEPAGLSLIAIAGLGFRAPAAGLSLRSGRGECYSG